MDIYRRKIFYLAGYDPRGARHYHGLLAQQLIAHAKSHVCATADSALAIGQRHAAGMDSGWTVADADGALLADFTFLGWDDLVRAHWVRGRLRLLGQVARAYGGFLAHLDWRLVGQWPRGTRFAVFSPGANLLVVPLLLAVLLATGLGALVPRPIAWGAGLAAAALVASHLARRLHSLWIARFMVFNDQFARRRTDPALDVRLARFANTIDAALGEKWDEVLLVTHSNGSSLSVPIMVQLLERHGGLLPPHFALITLGSCTQLLACRKDAGWFAALLDRLGKGGFAWLDIGSPTDGACAPLVAPCQGRAVGRPPGLVQLSPRWFRYSDPATYDARRRDKYQTHFDYLRRLDRPSPLDYPGLTCSSRPLAHSIAAFEAENASA